MRTCIHRQSQSRKDGGRRTAFISHSPRRRTMMKTLSGEPSKHTAPLHIGTLLDPSQLPRRKGCFARVQGGTTFDLYQISARHTSNLGEVPSQARGYSNRPSPGLVGNSADGSSLGTNTGTAQCTVPAPARPCHVPAVLCTLRSVCTAPW